MLFTDAVFVGVDPTAGSRPMHYAVLNGRLELQAMDAGDLESILAFIAGLDEPVVAVGAPQAPSQGLMLETDVRSRFNLQPGGRAWEKWRVAEYELRRRNIRLLHTPARVEDAPRWVQNGFQIFSRLKDMGFEMLAPEEPAKARSLIEVLPHAAYCALLQRRPFSKDTLEGRMQRQLVLYLEGLDVLNPVRVLEEITRHRLLQGHLPLHGLLAVDALDALVAAFTAYLSMAKPGRICQVGDGREGWVTLPTSKLNAFYP